MIGKMSSSSGQMRLLALLVVVALTIDVVAAAYCPTGCTCRSGEVRCLRARLNVVPKLPTDATIVDLRYNRLKEIPRNAFAGLAKLETLFLSENEISLLQDGCLDGLVSLRFLFLNNNRINNLPDTLFRQLQQLSVINLENNDLWQIRAETFHDLPYVNRITMNNNKIVNIAAGAFENMPNLRHVRLDGNPVNCDCGVYDLWRRYNDQVQRHQMAMTLYCQTPAPLRLYNFQSLQERDFHCKKPEIIAAPHDMQLVSGETVVLPCEMSGDPEPEIIWMHDTNEISGRGRRPGSHAGRMNVLANGALQINRVESNDIGIYECIGRNEVGETKTQPIRVQVEDRRENRLWPPVNEAAVESGAPLRQHLPLDLQGRGDHSPMFVHRPTDRVVALNGDAVVLDCTASGRPQPEILWYFNGRPVTQSTRDLQLYTNGSLAIVEPSTLTSGTYRCEARNPLGQVQASARIEARELPEILMAPQSQTIKVGKPLILECDADGNPVPEIKWQLDGRALASTARITLENENTELIISSAQASDAGVYTCIAENENGFTKATATITVERAGGPPNLIIAPYDLEALSGTTIEIPCQSDSDHNEATIQITWHRDGRLIDPNLPLTDKYEVSGTGSLFVKNVTIADGGRYECSVKNEYGRATASALVTIRNNVDLAPGDRYVRIAFTEAAKEIDLAINNTIDTLFTNRNRSGSAARPPPNYGDLLKVFRFPTGQARQLARAAEIYERTLVNIRKHVLQGDNLTVDSDRYEFKDLLSREHLHLVAELSGCMEHREMPNCTDMCFHSKYRSIDGTCNNLLHPTWGASLISFRRIEKPIYENGFSMPIGWTKDKLYAGYPKPSARLISTSLISTKETTPDDRITHMVMQWGQFLDHDLDHAIPSVSSESWDGVDCKKTCEFAPPCYPIEVPPNDPRVKNRRCIDVVRSSSICGSGMTSLFFDKVQHREQINQLTSFIDASQVYGYSPPFAQELRNLTTDDGLLRVGVHFPHQKDMLPFAAPQDGMDCRRNLDENQLNCFVSGDIRVNEQVGLLAMHTVWMREHNRIAALLRSINPHWDGDTVYQEARKIVGAQMQHITYQHWLPLIVGDSGMRMLGEYRGYDPQVEPTIANEFATAALRFGHTIINPVLHRLNASYEPIPQGHLQLHKAFFAPWRLAYEGGVDPLMRGMFSVAAKLKTPDQNLNTELTEKLFHTAHAVALDLAAINVQRGRDHGIPGYNVYRRFCNLTVAATFDDLSAEISSAAIREKLQQLYGHPDNVDVWVGGILEDQVEGGKVGPLFRCLLVEQFRRLRDGDRFYYENPTVFMPQQLAQIKQANLGRVLCDSGDNIEEVTENVFVLPHQQGGYKRCEDIAGINLYFWQDCGSCHNLPPLFDTYIPETYVKRGRRQRRSISPMEEEDEHEVSINQLYEVNEERVSGLEEVIGTFHKELKKLHKKIHKLEEACPAAAAKPSAAPKVDPPSPQQGSEAIRGGGGKPRRNHCVDRGGNTRLNNEVWSPNACSKCECRHAQITCYEQKCAELECDGGVSPVAPTADTCCPQCPPKVAN